jgi:hypothetical protein
MRLRKYSNDKSTRQQKTFLDALEGIGDVLVFETKRRKRNKNVIDGLKRLRGIITKFFALQHDDPKRFDRLLLSEDIHDLDEREALARLQLDPEKYLVSFSAAINQLLRVHEAALDSLNVEISLFATSHLNHVLVDLCQTSGNRLFVQQILEVLYGVARKASERQDISMYIASIHWYFDVVFNTLRHANHFDLDYLPLLDQHLFANAKFIISENKVPLFESLVSALVSRVHVPTYHKAKIYDYAHLIRRSDYEKYNDFNQQYGMEKRVRELHRLEEGLNTKAELESWLGKFEELRTILNAISSEEQKAKLNEMEEEIREFATSMFLFNNLMGIVIAIGAYCLFKDRPDFIKYLWEYKQPPDSDAVWVGHDIVPNTIGEVIDLFIVKGGLRRKFEFWEGHHGNEYYYRRYFILLLAKVLKAQREDPLTSKSVIDSYILPELPIHSLSDLEYSVDGFVDVANALKNEPNLLAHLGFPTDILPDLFEGKLIPFLSALKIKAQDRIKHFHRTLHISTRKVADFKKKIFTGLFEQATVRAIFVNFGIYEDITDQPYMGDPERFGISIVVDKSDFIDDWYVDDSELGKHYGNSMADGENQTIVDSIMVHCIERDETNFMAIIQEHPSISDLMIFTTHEGVYDYLQQLELFIPKWNKDHPQSDISGFEGWYFVEGNYVPVVLISEIGKGNEILLLNRKKLGKLVQRSPLNEGDNAESREGILFVEVEEFSTNQKLLDEYVKKSPPWLKEKGEEEKQREYLQERVLISIFERFEFVKNEDFEGYKMTFISTETL